MKEQFEKLSAERCTDLEFRYTMDVASVFEANDSNLINVTNLYLTRFGRIPNRFLFRDIDCKKANEWLMQNYQDNITDSRKTRNRQNVVYPLFDYQNQKACNFSTAQYGSLHHRPRTDECTHRQSKFHFRYRRRRKHHHRPQP